MVTLTLVGGPTLLIEVAGLRFLTDPTFDPPGSYNARGVTLVKTEGPALSLEAIGPIDVVLLSHEQHLDNLDHAGRAVLSRAGQVVTTAAGAPRIEGASAVGLAPWSGLEVAGAGGARLRVTATPARHGPVGIEPISGDVIGFVISGEDCPTIYVSGDTVWYEGVAEVARRHAVDLAILFTGSAEPRGPFHVTMDSNDAIEAAHAFDRATIVAIHNEGWQHFRQSQEDLVRAFSALGLRDRLLVLERGIPVEVPHIR